jgi:hypothetical protein
MKQIITEKKVCRRCGFEKPIEEFRKRPSGFILNQCKSCESELGAERRKSKTTTIISITTKSGKLVEASMKQIEGGRKATSPNTDKVLYFNSNVDRDTARIAFSAYAEVPRTGIQYQLV